MTFVSSEDPTTGLPFPNLFTTTSSPAVVPADQNGYINLGLTVDPAQLTADAFGFIQNQIPGWTPADGNLETWVVMACARMVSVSSAIAQQMSLAVFQYLGGALLNLPPEPGSVAQIDTTWTMVDTKGYTVPAGTVAAFATSGNTLVPFQTTAAFTVPAGQTQTAAGAVPMVATAVGTAANGIPAGALQLVDSLAYVSTVVSVAPAAGGSTVETVEQYLNRLSAVAQLLTPRPILAADFAALAVQANAGATRALAIDTYNPLVNSLTEVDASFETGTGSWGASGSNTTVGQATAWSADGTHSFALTAIGAGTISAASGVYPVAPNQQWSGAFVAHAAATGRQVTAQLAWYATANGTALSGANGTATVDTTTGGTQIVVTGTSPANAAYVALDVSIAGCAAGEVHYIDEALLNLGAASYAWNPGGQAGSQERTVTVVPVDVAGNALTTGEMNAIQAYLEALRELNFLVYVIPPTYFPVTIGGQVICEATSNINTVQAAIDTALTAYLSPATWAGGDQLPPVWNHETSIFLLNVAAIIGAVPGVRDIVSLTVNGTANLETSMPGVGTLPQPTVNVTVSTSAIFGGQTTPPASVVAPTLSETTPAVGDTLTVASTGVWE